MLVKKMSLLNTLQTAGKSYSSKLAAIALPALLAPTLVFGATTYDQARVVAADPIYETVQHTVPTEQCHEEKVAYATHNRRKSVTGPILGAIIGGALGNALGHGKSNRQVGTVVGAVLGGSIGADISRRNRAYAGDDVRYRTEEVCRVSHEIREEEQLAGYNVSYVYGGETYRTRMSRDPGDSLRVRVRVTPAE